MIKNKGFTLIELLVTISIIGLLASIATFALTNAQKSARDGKRKADLENVAIGLELYRSDCGAYPSGVSFGGTLMGSGSCNGVTYISDVPNDPKAPRVYRYYSVAPFVSYKLCALLEETPGTTYNVTGCLDCETGVSCNYSISRP